MQTRPKDATTANKTPLIRNCQASQVYSKDVPDCEMNLAQIAIRDPERRAAVMLHAERASALSQCHHKRRNEERRHKGGFPVATATEGVQSLVGGSMDGWIRTRWNGRFYNLDRERRRRRQKVRLALLVMMMMMRPRQNNKD